MADNTVAYGFIGLEHLFKDYLDNTDVQKVREAINASAAEWDRQIAGIMRFLAERTTEFKVRFELPGAGTLQPLDEWGNPRPVVDEGKYDVGFPIMGGGTAWGTNRVTQALMTVEDANRETLAAMRRDADWLRRHALAALLDNVAWSFDDPKHGAITIEPLANADAVLFPRLGAPSATDTHYLAQAAAIADATNPFPTIFDELVEHPGNGNTVVCYAPTNLKASIKALTNFIPVDNPRVSTVSDRVVTDLDGFLGPANAMLGEVDSVIVAEWRALPDNYMLAFCPDAGPALEMREYPARSLQGFFTENHSPDGNLREQRFIRYAGFGVKNRVSALVYMIGAAAYAIPTGFDAPQPV